MFAVIKTGGKQYRVAAEDVIRIDRVSGQPGEIVEFGEVLVVGGDTPQLGTPKVAGATVAGEVLQHTRGDKVIAFKKRRRKNSRRKRGYRHEKVSRDPDCADRHFDAGIFRQCAAVLAQRNRSPEIGRAHV